MAELRGLAEACGLKAVSVLVQNAPAVTHATYIGSGKVLELKKEVEEFDADIVLFNEALTPMQTRNLEKVLDTEVLDRTGLILQIFALRARTREAKLQVESAQLQYMLPRLAGMRTNLSRQGGGSGRLSNKGAGEQKLELDRRRIEHRIAELRRELDVVSRERATQRNRRMRTGMTRVALVGYTNAGKSTVMNALLKYCAGTSGSGTGSFSPADRSPLSGSLKNTDPAGESFSDSAARGSFKDPSNISGPISRDRMSSPIRRSKPGARPSLKPTCSLPHSTPASAGSTPPVIFLSSCQIPSVLSAISLMPSSRPSGPPWTKYAARTFSWRWSTSPIPITADRSR